MDIFKKILDVIYKENKDKISLSKKQFLDKYSEQDIDMKFMFSLKNDIDTIYTLTKSLIDKDIEDISIAYLIICTMCVIYEEPKESYRRIFSELRLRNVYKYSTELEIILQQIYLLYNYHFKIDIKDMFKEDMFKKIIKHLSIYIKDNSITMEQLSEALKDGWEDNQIKEDIDIKSMLEYIFDKTNIDSDFLNSFQSNDKILLWDEWKTKYGEDLERIDED